MELRRYEGPRLDGERPHPALSRLLDCRDLLVEIRPLGVHRGGPRVLLGVPHHAKVGVDQIAERRPEGGRVADENAVLYALVALERLAARGLPAALLVAAHATDHDPNKGAGSPYCRRVLASGASLLVECHGAGVRAPHDLEVSAGSNRRADPVRFGRGLARALGPGFHVAAQSVPGQRAALLMDARGAGTGAAVLRFPALRTTSLRAAGERGMEALHLEAKPRFRSRGDGSASLTASGRRLGCALAEAIAAYVEGLPGSGATGSP